MIIDSHAHYNNSAYQKPFRYLSYDKDGYSLKEDESPQPVLPAVIKKIAELKGFSPGEAEQATTENTIRLFRLLIAEGAQ